MFETAGIERLAGDGPGGRKKTIQLLQKVLVSFAAGSISHSIHDPIVYTHHFFFYVRHSYHPIERYYRIRFR